MTSFTEISTSDEVASHFTDQIKNKTVLITGCSWASNCIGAEVALVTAKYGAEQVIICSRRKEVVAETEYRIIEQVPSAKLISCVFDLGCLKSVREAAREINSNPEINKIDVLVNCAEVMACRYEKTKDGFESQFGVNHLGHFLFTNLIIDKILAGAAPRIVNVSSYGHNSLPIRFNDIGFSNGDKYVPFQAYGQSKTANILFSKELHEKYNKSDGLASFSVHPGVVTNNLLKHVDTATFLENANTGDKGESEDALLNTFFKTVSQGAAPVINVSFNPSIGELSGSYANEFAIHKSFGNDVSTANKLWNLSEILVGETFYAGA